MLPVRVRRQACVRMTNALEHLQTDTFEIHEARLPPPRVHVGCFVKVGIRRERFWCRVCGVCANGTLRATVDNDLVRSAWSRGHELVLQSEHVLEAADDTERLTFQWLVDTLGSEREAALAWQDTRIASGAACRRKAQTYFAVLPSK